MHVYISHNYKGITSAGNKAKTDVENILRSEGFRNIGLPQTHFRNKILSFSLTLVSVLIAMFRLHRGDVLFLQYPFKKYFCLICNVAHCKGAKVIVLVHDLGCFRRKALTPEQDIARLCHSDYIIALTDNMCSWLVSNGCDKPCGTLDFWDYLSSSEKNSCQSLHIPLRVAYAGSLNGRKNAFLFEWVKNKHPFLLSLYGHHFDATEVEASFAHFEGFVSSDEFVARCGDDFGLVWDGVSTIKCSGSYGEYLRLNAPHKASFYIRSGLPVIVWTASGIAPVVQSEGVGLCINSLEDLDDLLPRVTEEEYKEMKAHVASLSEKINKGHFLRRALHEALSALCSEG